MSKNYLLGIDIGTSACKVAVHRSVQGEPQEGLPTLQGS